MTVLPPALGEDTPGAAREIKIIVECSDERFEARVRETALAALAELGIEAARVTVRDRSALDCVIRARVLAACLRAAGADDTGVSSPGVSSPIPWEDLR